MLSKQFKALTVVLLAMGVGLPALSIPAAAVVPAQIGAGGNSGTTLGNSHLLTEVGSRHYGDRNAYRRYRYDDYYFHNHHYGHTHGHYNNYRVHLGGGGIGLGYGDGYRVYLGGDFYSDDYYGGREYVYGGHVEWCLNRYRSYNPRTNTFMGYDGYHHRCNSPYD
jgi:hypothetical protein